MPTCCSCNSQLCWDFYYQEQPSKEQPSKEWFQSMYSMEGFDLQITIQQISNPKCGDGNARHGRESNFHPWAETLASKPIDPFIPSYNTSTHSFVHSFNFRTSRKYRSSCHKGIEQVVGLHRHKNRKLCCLVVMMLEIQMIVVVLKTIMSGKNSLFWCNHHHDIVTNILVAISLQRMQTLRCNMMRKIRIPFL